MSWNIIRRAVKAEKRALQAVRGNLEVRSILNQYLDMCLAISAVASGVSLLLTLTALMDQPKHYIIDWITTNVMACLDVFCEEQRSRVTDYYEIVSGFVFVTCIFAMAFNLATYAMINSGTGLKPSMAEAWILLHYLVMLMLTLTFLFIPIAFIIYMHIQYMKVYMLTYEEATKKINI